MIRDKKASTVRSSGTSRFINHLTLSEKLTPSLISAGLVKGTTRSFGQRLLNRGIRGIVLFEPDGTVAGEQKEIW